MNSVERVKAICKERRIPISRLEKDLGYANGYIGQLRKGVFPDDRLVEIAAYLSISVNYLLTGEQKNIAAQKSNDIPKGAIPYKATGYIPVIGYIPAGYPTLATDEILGYEPTDIANPDECFWLIVKGDSMINAGIRPGDMVLIRHQPCADDGQIVACRVNGDEATLKRFKHGKDCMMLIPENPAYEPRIIPVSDFESGYASIIGVVIESKRKYL